CQAQNHDVMAEIARGTFLPIATGERVFTKWGFREVLEKKAATVLQPDLCHAGGITEVRLIAGMADKIGHDWRNQESYDAEDNSVVDW
ncbi:MAG TPA: enolase C-terminal domain-like protein, partial [Bryobacteraceae bacterium]|nr:enolase C-terminal domain-like protein [Bryobacteraceae bacterium]